MKEVDILLCIILLCSAIISFTKLKMCVSLFIHQGHCKSKVYYTLFYFSDINWKIYELSLTTSVFRPFSPKSPKVPECFFTLSMFQFCSLYLLGFEIAFKDRWGFNLVDNLDSNILFPWFLLGKK